jgi:fructose-1,6-bisphosphatase/sedoheptulose 1,7-bisphosphatase-like protein
MAKVAELCSQYGTEAVISACNIHRFTVDILTGIQTENESENKSETEHKTKRAKCQGCIDNQPNQLAHVGENGCLGDW